jgi:hypothetical protein
MLNRFTNKDSSNGRIQVTSSFAENGLTVKENHIDAGKLLKND